MSCTCDEEAGRPRHQRFDQAVERSRERQTRAPRPDLAVIAEPTELDVVVANKGATRWKIRTRGRACHSSDPSQGVNAIYRMARVVESLEEFAAKLPTQIPPHSLSAPPRSASAASKAG